MVPALGKGVGREAGGPSSGGREVGGPSSGRGGPSSGGGR